jgi:hypothetical protein
MLISEEFVVYKYPCKSTSTRHPIAHSFSYIWEKSIKKINKKKKITKNLRCNSYNGCYNFMGVDDMRTLRI